MTAITLLAADSPSRSRAPERFAAMSSVRNARLTGAPVNIAFCNLVGKYATAVAVAFRDCSLVANPGNRSYETVKNGIPSFVAAREAATLPYPPTDITTFGLSVSNNFTACLVAIRNDLSAEIFCLSDESETLRLKPRTSKSEIGILVGGTSFVSIPLVVPIMCRF